MTTFQIERGALTLTAALAYLNTRLLGLPSSVGIMAASLIGSMLLLGLALLGLVDNHATIRPAGVLRSGSLP